METKKYFPTVEAIENASRVLDEIIEPTPFMRNSNLSDLYDADVYLKREDLQIVRSYKIRGAYNKIRSIEPEVLKYGIVCASAGNHAQGVAYAAQKFGCKVVIVMPTVTPLIKVNRTKNYGAEVILYGDVYDDACEYALKLAEEKGYTFVQAAVEMVPQNYVKLESEEDIKNMEKLIDLLEENDDVQNVYHNWDQD